jgi:hypothetical protein
MQGVNSGANSECAYVVMADRQKHAVDIVSIQK